jgi:hypothetical protein
VTAREPRIPPLSRTDQIVHCCIALAGIVYLAGSVAVAGWTTRVVIVAAVIAGAAVMRSIRRLPWGAERSTWVSPLTLFFVPGGLVAIEFNLDLVLVVLVSSYIGLIGYSYVCYFRSRRLRLFGVWPR